MPTFRQTRPTENHSIPTEWLVVRRASDIFDEMCYDFIDEISRIPGERLPGSARLRDAQVDDIGVRFALCVRDHILFALDLALGASRCVKDPTLNHAAYSCARSVLEACSTLHWLLDPEDGSGSKGRFAELMQLYGRDVWNERDSDSLASQRSKRTEDEIKRLSEMRFQGAIAIADELGLDHKRKSQEVRPTFASEHNATIRAGNFIEGGDSEYRLYSRVVHCDTRAWQETWMAKPNIPNSDEVKYAPERALRLITNLATWFARATHEVYLYFGFDLVDLDTRLRVYFTRLRIHKSRWTWATPTNQS